MNKFIAVCLAVMAVGCYGAKGYDKALDKCKAKCYPYVVRSVEYNFENNKYDKCACNLTIKVEEINEGE